MTCPQVQGLNLDPIVAQQVCQCAETRINWIGAVCPTAFQSMVFTSPNGKSGYNPANLTIAQGIVNGIVSQYLADGYRITEPNVTGYNPFQESLRSTCNQVPGLCDSFLSQYCLNKPTTNSNLVCGIDCETRNGIAQNTGLLEFCGCWAPPPVEVQANDPNNQALNILKKYPQCDPICNRQETIQRGDGMGGEESCPNNTVCVIDDTTINAAKSTVGGGVSFQQICPCASTGICTCIISGTNLTSTLVDNGLTTQFNQVCGTNALCLQLNETGIPTPVNCQTALSQNPPSFWSTLSKREWFFIALGFIGFILLIILMIFVVVIGKNQNAKREMTLSSAQVSRDLKTAGLMTPVSPVNG